MELFTPEEEYRQLLKEGKMTYEELQAVLEGKKSEVVREVVERRFAISGNELDSQSDLEYNNVINNGEVNSDERELLNRIRKSGELGQEHNSDTSYRRSEMGKMGSVQSQKPNTPKTRSIHRSGVSAQGLTERECQELIKKWRRALLDTGRGTRSNRTLQSEGRRVSATFEGEGEAGALQEVSEVKDTNKHYALSSYSKEGMSDSEIENAQTVIKGLKTRAMSSKYLDGYASYTSERMERELKASSSSDVIDYAKSYIKERGKT